MSNFVYKPAVPFEAIVQNAVKKVYIFAMEYGIESIKKQDGFYRYVLEMSPMKDHKQPWTGEFETDYDIFRRNNCSTGALGSVSEPELKKIFAHIYTGNKCNLVCQCAKVMFDEIKATGTTVLHSIRGEKYKVDSVDSVVIDMRAPSCMKVRFSDGYVETYPKPTPPNIPGVFLTTVFEDGGTSTFNPVLHPGQSFHHVVLELNVTKIGNEKEQTKVAVDPTYQFPLTVEGDRLPAVGDAVTHRGPFVVGREMKGGVDAYIKYMEQNGAWAKTECVEENLVDFSEKYGDVFSTSNMKRAGIGLLNKIRKGVSVAPRDLLEKLCQSGCCIKVPKPSKPAKQKPNAPCGCQSGKKAKKCCMAVTAKKKSNEAINTAKKKNALLREELLHQTVLDLSDEKNNFFSGFEKGFLNKKKKKKKKKKPKKETLNVWGTDRKIVLGPHLTEQQKQEWRDTQREFNEHMKQGGNLEGFFNAKFKK